MSNQPEVIVTIDPRGNVEVEADGVVGKGCEALTQPMEDALGAKSGGSKKPEYLREAKAQNQAPQG